MCYLFDLGKNVCLFLGGSMCHLFDLGKDVCLCFGEQYVSLNCLT